MVGRASFPFIGGRGAVLGAGVVAAAVFLRALPVAALVRPRFFVLVGASRTAFGPDFFLSLLAIR